METVRVEWLPACCCCLRQAPPRSGARASRPSAPGQGRPASSCLSPFRWVAGSDTLKSTYNRTPLPGRLAPFLSNDKQCHGKRPFMPRSPPRARVSAGSVFRNENLSVPVSLGNASGGISRRDGDRRVVVICAAPPWAPAGRVCLKGLEFGLDGGGLWPAGRGRRARLGADGAPAARPRAPRADPLFVLFCFQDAETLSPRL